MSSTPSASTTSSCRICRRKNEEDTRPEIYKKLDRLTLQGWAYIRQDHYESSGASMGRQRTLTHLTENGIDVSLGYTYKFNDNWSFIGSADFYRNLNHEDTTANMNMKSMYLLGHMHGYDIRAGHYDPANGLGMVFSDSIDGAGCSGAAAGAIRLTSAMSRPTIRTRPAPITQAHRMQAGRALTTA